MRKCALQTLDGTEKQYTAYYCNEFPFQDLRLIAQKSRKKKGDEILSNFATFDIETTTITEPVKVAFMYHWQMCVQGILVYGRYWDEWVKFIKKLAFELELGETRKFVIYVHNLPFEFQFMRDFLKEELGGFTGFYIDKRKPLSVRCTNGIEFRCSWKLTNMSLEKACKFERGVEIGKQSGDLDYKKIRTPVTPITDKEFGYCMADVLSLYQLIENRLLNEFDTLESIPMTSTGYVRRDCRRATEKQTGYRELFLSTRLTDSVYTLLKEAARGGDTHANRFLSGRIIQDVDSFDVQSSYPAMLKMRKFPMTKFVPYGDVESKEELDKLLAEKACLFRVAFTNLRLKEHIAMPYLSSDKALNLSGERLDNGRVLSADIARYTLTDVDYRIIAKQYDWDENEFYVSDMHVAEYGYLPESILSIVDKYFELKTRLKGEIAKAKKRGDAETLNDLEYQYAKSKNRLNAIFGMMYTDPVRETITLTEDGEWNIEDKDLSEELEKYYKSRNSFLYYAWGIWTTAHAREHLNRLVNLTGQDTTIYCDTDSSKCYASKDIRDAVSAANREIAAEAETRNAYCDYDGVRYYMGIYEHEANYVRFKTLGAKKYVYEQYNKEGVKELHVTISGVNKEQAPYELGRLENFVPGFTFLKAGGLEMEYVDMPIREITVNGCTFKTASCIASTDSTYEVGITGEYAEVIGYNCYADIEKMEIF